MLFLQDKDAPGSARSFLFSIKTKQRRTIKSRRGVKARGREAMLPGLLEKFSSSYCSTDTHYRNVIALRPANGEMWPRPLQQALTINIRAIRV